MTKTETKAAALIAAITAYAAEFIQAGDCAGFLEDFAINAGVEIDELTDTLQDNADQLKEMRLADEFADEQAEGA
ncbi:hypothetical protein SynSYN20_01604 [Synechococcus sp. SYN20]|uniref:hypothetical protein n=1 Tax=Synechococcus sp. SYN20 TaxID=1050714 RepID=UPI001647BB3A|nr:hypothetical protein [Synechococcus sp. SYN20]QNJ25931.1 hypothetical protein SynSYN20_01604 [Synechococcus sp. SYN20]